MYSSPMKFSPNRCKKLNIRNFPFKNKNRLWPFDANNLVLFQPKRWIYQHQMSNIRRSSWNKINLKRGQIGSFRNFSSSCIFTMRPWVHAAHSHSKLLRKKNPVHSKWKLSPTRHCLQSTKELKDHRLCTILHPQ